MRKHLTFFFIVISLLLLAACQNTTAEDNRFTVAFPWSPANLDPHGSENWEVMRAGIAETLVGLDENLEPLPWLAKEWKQEDDNTWIFDLQENVTFHNGKEMNAEHVKASLEHSLEVNQRAADLLQLETIEIVDEYTLKMVTNEPNAALIPHLADPSTIIADVSVEGDEASFPTLTGAFKVKEFNIDESLIVERFDEYWGEHAKLPEIEIRYISEGETRLMALQSGEVDAAADIPMDNIPVLENDSAIEVHTAPSLRTHMLLYNMESPFFKELLHRKAVEASIPKEEIVRSVMMDQGTVAYSPFSDVLLFGEVGVEEETIPVKDLMEESGWSKNEESGLWEKDGEPVELTMLTFPQRPELTVMGEIIQSELLNEGITVHLRQVENIDEALTTEEWDFSMYSMLTAHTGDPQYFLNIFYHSSSPSNVSSYKSDEMDQMIENLNRTTDIEERHDLAVQMQEKLNEDLPQSFIVYPETVFAAKSGVEGFIPHPIEYYYIHSSIEMES
ncbi:ABC transporter substrate-binding protein [Bacillus sp. FJAT-44742]|uniref:ABC transporter substrate-binding protein n=1 Tax=Bacillus sp. FJAT-44742 TaxID=2014005 RepID=UPI000C24E477|nr:ABC transporter substrate-binding protein [Bacillus sp. FJAT-44742]